MQPASSVPRSQTGTEPATAVTESGDSARRNAISYRTST